LQFQSDLGLSRTPQKKVLLKPRSVFTEHHSGTHERFIGFLIEHFAGNFPTWLAPVQVYVLPVRENHEDLAKEITKKLHNQFVRVEYLDSSE
jgi:threonyl-tRNA synthetase